MWTDVSQILTRSGSHEPEAHFNKPYKLNLHYEYSAHSAHETILATEASYSIEHHIS